MRRTCSLVLVAALASSLPAAAQAAPPVTPAPMYPAPAPAAPAPSAPEAAPPTVAPGSQQERQELEQQTKLDLSKQWRAYQARRKGESFYWFVEEDLRRKRDIGRGLTFGGLGGLVVGAALFSVGIPQPDQPIPLTISGYAIMGVSGVSTIVGSVLWGVMFKKMEKLEVAEYRGIALGKRVRLRSFTATSLQLAF